MRHIKVHAPAKVNLSLDVAGVRPDGYHLLKMVMQSVSLEDVVELAETDSGTIEIVCTDPNVPLDKRNIVFKAADAFFAFTSLPLKGLTISILKNIPAMAGLAGGSTDGAAVLFGLNCLYGTSLSSQTLCDIGAGVGADIPFCLVGGTAFVEGIGERITPLPSLTNCWILIVKPKTGIQTAASFRLYDQIGSPVHPHTSKLLQAIHNRDLQKISGSMCNVLQQMQIIGPVEEIQQKMRERGALGAVMTGSGSAVIGLYDKYQAAMAAFADFKAEYEQSYLTTPLNHGVYLP